jgi:HPt (histidine-containing phosphotransfer) domain-containing protein
LQDKLAKWFAEKIVSKNSSKETNYFVEKQNEMETTQTQTQEREIMDNILNKTSITKILSLVKNNKSRFNILINSFNEDMTELVKNSKKAVENQDNKELIANIHTIKGVSGTIGTIALYEFSKDFYAQIQNNEVLDMPKSLNILEDLYQQASKALKEVSDKLI